MAMKPITTQICWTGRPLFLQHESSHWVKQHRTEGAIMLSRFFAGLRKALRSVFRSRVKAGPGRRGDPGDGAVGAGVTVPLKPPPPVLVGKEAKAFPKIDDDADRSDLAA